MFSNRIANSARFLQMPAEAQMLYFHMILRADDDGVVESYPLMKLLGVATDNYKILTVKGFIKILNEDQVVVITDWLEHNVIRPDRKVDSIYKHLLPPDIKVITPKPRSDVKDNSKRTGGQSTDGISKVKLSKVKTSKDNKLPAAIATGDPVNQLLDVFYNSINPTINYAHKGNRDAAQWLINKYGIEQTLRTAEYACSLHGKSYAPQITTPYQLKEKLSLLKGYYESNREKTTNQSKTRVIDLSNL